MKQLLNTLYVTSRETKLSLSNNAIVAEHPKTHEKQRIVGNDIESILCFGNVSVTTPLIKYCGEKGITLSFYSEYGRFYGRIQGPVCGNILLRQAQFSMLEDNAAACVTFMQTVLINKLKNSRDVLMRGVREAEPSRRPEFDESLKMLEACIEKAGNERRQEVLRGLEGIGARAYFDAFCSLIHSDEQEMQFSSRSRRPPQDRVNALMSFLYTLLANDTQSALESVGLDPACGFIHALRPGKPALALDVMEELRAPLCDRLVLTLLHRKQIGVDSFEYEDGLYRLKPDARRKVLDAWQTRKHEEIYHSVFKERVPIGLIPFCQSQLLARHVRGEEGVYHPFRWR